jgi:WD40 repeat protein
LFQLIEDSRTVEEEETEKARRIASANAATVLNAARVSFSRRNLKRVCLQHADLASAIMSCTDLEGADLRDTKLNKVWLQGAILKNAKLAGATFGELAFKKYDDHAWSCDYSSDGKLIAVGTGKLVIVHSLSASGAVLPDVLYTFEGHTDEATCVCFSKDCKWIASGSAFDKNWNSSSDYTIRLWYASVGYV